MAVHPGEFRRARHAVIAVVLFCLLCLTGCGEAASPTASAAEGPLPTVVLVHGAFADASSWNGVVTRLQKRGYTIVAPALGMRGLASDSAYLASLLSQIKGPVVLAGHSYGGAVISNAATGADNVKALVFVNGFATEDGEVLSTVEKGSTDSALNPALEKFNYPAGNSTTGVELPVDPAKFPAVFGGDLPLDQAALLAATQRPIAASAFSEPSGPPAWKSRPRPRLTGSAPPEQGGGAPAQCGGRCPVTIWLTTTEIVPVPRW
jgi:pimeloyl-ACP methyl ester carboxylesterase